MLRTEEKGLGRSWSRPLAVLLLGIIVFGVSALRDPAQADDKPQAKSQQVKPVPQPEEKPPGANRPPFEYCYCSPEAVGFYAFRPSAFFGADPRMQKLAAEAIAAGMKVVGGPESFPKIAEIEQISGCIFLNVHEQAPKGQRHGLQLSLLTLRTTGACDWKRIFESFAKKVVEGQFEGHTYCKVAASDFKSPALFGVLADSAARGDKTVYFFQPDERTLVMGSEEQFQKMVHDGPSAKPAWALTAGWKQVENGVFAAAITNQEGRFAKLWLTSPPEEIPAEVNAAIAKTTALVFGIDYDRELCVADLFTACADQNDADTVAKAILAWISKGFLAVHEALEKQSDTTDAGPDPRLLWGEKFLEQIRFHFENKGDQTIVHARSGARVNVTKIFDLLSGAKVQAVESKND